MQQRQLRLGDILDDYCPRERRVTNHAVVAMIGEEVRQTRCTTCDAEHEYKHAKVPRPRKKDEPAGIPGQVIGAPRRIVHDAPPVESDLAQGIASPTGAPSSSEPAVSLSAQEDSQPAQADEALAAAGNDDDGVEDGPVHRTLIRATLPRHEGQAPPARQAPDFTIRQPAGRPPNRFRGRNQRGGPMFQGNHSGNSMGGGQGRGPSSARPQGGRGPQNSISSRPPRRQDAGRKRSK